MAGRASPGDSKGFRRSKHGLHVTRHLDLTPNLPNDALGVDQERGPVHSHVFAAV